MRRFALAALLVGVASPALAEPMAAGSVGVVFGPVSGTGADAKRLGAGIQYGGQATWQPMSTDRPFGYSLRWATMFGRVYGGTAAQIDDSLSTVQMDLMVGLRYRPWTTPRRYLTVRAGAGLLRANEPIPTDTADGTDMMKRSFLGGVASVGLDQYVYNFLLNIDVRYGLIGSGPSQVSLVIGFGLTGP